jgi:glycosyltransferase involved in cell wall biosynthesis
VRASLTSLAARGYAAFEVSLADGEASLDPIEAWERPQDVVVLSRAALDGLSAPAVAARPPLPALPPAPHSVVRPGAMRQAAAAPARLGIDWEIRSDTGWGVYGTHLALELAARADVAPTVFAADLSETSPVDRWRLQQLPAVSVPVGSPVEFDGVMLRALGNNMAHGPLWDLVRSRRQVGEIFFDDTAFDPLMLDRARGLDRVIAGSQWNASVLQACGLHNVTVVQQGVDSTVFHPAPASGRLGDRFVIFSGGKLEYRKGQDLVIAAFRRFRKRHPEALLLTAWHNHWPQLIDDLALAGHVTGVPELRHGVLQIAPWLEANGVPGDAVLDVGRVPNALMGRVVREAHVALFPNRAEGGTNLVAMECMAAGVPAIVACNTGHLDLVATNGCLPLRRQSTVPAPSRFYRSTDGWGESDVDEIVEVLEHAWSDRDALRATAARGAGTMQGWSWRSQVDRLVTALRPLF